MKLRRYAKLMILIFVFLICSYDITTTECEEIQSNETSQNYLQNQGEVNKIKIKYTAKYNGEILVSLNLEESVKKLTGWTLSKDKQNLTKIYTAKQTENVVVTTENDEKINVTVNVPSTVVFVGASGNDENDGANVEKMVRTLSKAYEIIGNNTGMIVMCSDYTIEEDYEDQIIALPEHEKEIMIVGSYIDNNNESVNNIKFRYQEKKQEDNKSYSSRLFLNGPTFFDNLNIYSTGAIYAQGNNLTIGENVDNYYHPSIYGGFFVKGQSSQRVSCSDYIIEINSGRWKDIVGANFRYNENQNFGEVGNVNLIINGGEFIGKVAVGGYSQQSGYYKLKITGGTFSSNIYGIYSGGTINTKYIPTKNGNVEIEITGGTFKSTVTRICAMYDTNENAINGDYSLKITDGVVFENIDALTISAKNVNGTANAIVPENLISKLSCFGSNIYVSNEGNDSNSGLTEAQAVKTLNKAFEKISEYGGTIIVCGNVEYSETSQVELKQCQKKVVITSKFNEKDYEGICVINGNIKFNSEVNIENITLTASSEKTISANGNNLTIGENVNSLGNIILDGGKGEKSHTISIESGTWNEVIGGQVTNEKEYNIVKILGGTVNEIYGTGSKENKGSVNIVIEGGTIGKIYEGKNEGKIEKNAGILILDKSNNFDLNNANEKYIITDYRQDDLLESNVVFVKDNVIDDKYISMLEASSKLSSTGGTIVICGETTIDSLRMDSKENTKITSVYNGIDYRKIDNAKICLGAIAFNGSVEIENVDILATIDSSYISLRGNKGVFGEGINCSVWYEKGVKIYPSITGGVMSGAVTNKSPDITIKSGTWGNIIGGNGNNKDMNNNINIEIDGGTFEGCIKLGNMGNFKGNISLDINNGIFNCPIYGIPYSTSLYNETSTMTGNITININGGMFSGVINAKEGYTVDSNEENIIKFNDDDGNFKYVLNINGGNLDRISQIKGLTDGKSKLNIVDSIDIKSKIDTSIEYKNPIEYYPDPEIMYLDGYYYFAYKGYYDDDEAIYVKKAANICDIENSTPVLIYHTDLIWAPRLYNINGEVYIYMLDMDGEANTYGVPIILKAKDPTNPLGEYEEPVALKYGYENGETISLSHDFLKDNVYEWLEPKLFVYNEKLYMSFGGITRDTKEEATNGTIIDSASGKTIKHDQQIFLVEMYDPITIKADSITTRDENGNITKIDVPVIMESTKDWEGDENDTEIWRVIEGAFPIVNENELYIMYTAGNATSESYCTGLLKYIGTNGDLMDFANWGKYEKPILESNVKEKIFSLGGTTLVTGVMAQPISYSESGEVLEEYSEAGKVIGYSDTGEFIAVYQGKPYANTYWRKRYTYIQKAKWVEEQIILEPTMRDSNKKSVTITTKVLKFYNEETKEFDSNTIGGKDVTYTIKANSMALSNRISDMYITGDINQDKEVNVSDLLLLKRHLIAGSKTEWILTGNSLDSADINESGNINIADLLLEKRLLLKNMK